MSQSINGQWDNGIQWELSVTSILPPPDLITAVFCIAIAPDDQVVLARSKRGWGVLGGHIEAGETVEEALFRESIEEGGFTPSNPQLFAVMKIIPEAPVLKPKSNSEYYPFPDSYQVYYWAKTDSLITQPVGKEIIESRSFSLPEIEQLAISDYQIIDLGYKAYQTAK